MKPADRRPGRRVGAAAKQRTARIAAVRSQVDLDGHDPHGPDYIRSQRGALSDFLSFTADNGISCDIDVLSSAPRLLSALVRAYGLHEYSRGGPLYAYLCLLTALVRRDPLLKPWLAPGWLLANDWRALEPVTHRLPTPAPMFRALVVLALVAGWTRWAACTAIAFNAPGRIGEVLRATRSCLVLPSDDLGEHPDRALLRVERPKSGLRGGARVQHMTIVGLRWVRLLELAFGSLSDDCKLYPFSDSTYRSRWDVLISSLGVPSSMPVTPGGLRGGGAVAQYMHGTHIVDLLWSMRLKDTTSLAHYLQEVTAVSSLRALPTKSRSAIAAADALFERLLPAS